MPKKKYSDLYVCRLIFLVKIFLVKIKFIRYVFRSNYILGD